MLTEIARVLKPGGRVGVSDVVAEDSLSAEERAARVGRPGFSRAWSRARRRPHRGRHRPPRAAPADPNA